MDKFMTYKEFVTWSNKRAADGCWGIAVAIFCIELHGRMKAVPFWKRKKAWEAENKNNQIYEQIVKPINEKITELYGEAAANE